MQPNLPLFVYGALKKHELNYPRFISEWAVDHAFARLSGARLFEAPLFPYLTVDSDPMAIVRGELWWFPPNHARQVLTRIDELEGVSATPTNGLNQRCVGLVENLDSGEMVRAWIHVATRTTEELIENEQLPLIVNGVWTAREPAGL